MIHILLGYPVFWGAGSRVDISSQPLLFGKKWIVSVNRNQAPTKESKTKKYMYMRTDLMTIATAILVLLFFMAAYRRYGAWERQLFCLTGWLQMPL
jgi:hypothetical protein